LPSKINLSNYFFAPRFFFSRFNLNLFAVLFISIGLLTGIYLTLSKIILPSIFASGSSVFTLEYSASTASSYIYDSSKISVTNSGAQAISQGTTNKFINSVFDSNNNSWNITPNIVFATRNNYSAIGATYPYSVVSSDFNSDSKADLVTANTTSNNITVFTNIGGTVVPVESFTGTSFPPTGYSMGGNGSFFRDTSSYQDSPASAASGAISHGQNEWIERSITMTGNGNVSFYWKVSSEGSYDYLYVCVDNSSCTRSSGYNQRISGTVNWTPVTISLTAGTHTIRWGYGKDGSVVSGSDRGWVDAISFTTNISSANYSTIGTSPRSVKTTDFNSDTKSDIVTANSGSNDITVFTNSGTGTFGTGVTYPTIGTTPYSVAVADFNSDTKSDIVTANSGSNDITVFTNSGTGTFGTGVTYPTIGTNPTSVLSTDIDGDGKSDIVTANKNSNNITVFTNSGTGTFGTGVTYPTIGNGPLYIVSADFDGDGKADLATTNYSSNNITVFINSGTGGVLNVGVTYPINGTNPYSIIATDLTGDGKADLATANYNSNNISVLTNTGTGTFNTPITFPTNETFNPLSITSADFNSDGKTDLITANPDQSIVSVFLNNSSSQIWESSPPSGRSGGANKIIAGSSDTKIYQTINTISLSNYNLSAYVYNNTTGSVGGTVDSSIAQLEYAGVGIGTTYTDVGSGWWKLEGTINNIIGSQEFGVIVKANKTVYLDDFVLVSFSDNYSIYNNISYSNSKISSWDSISADTDIPGNSSIIYQISTDNNSSWQFWDTNVNSWTNVSNTGVTPQSTQSFTDVTFPPTGFTTGGNNTFSRDTSTYYSSPASAASGYISENGNEWMETTTTLPASGNVSYWWKVSSESCCDFLYICVDNSNCNRYSGYSQRIAGTVNWTPVTVPLTAGTHTIRWGYGKDGSVVSGSDKGWVDNISFNVNNPNYTDGNTIDQLTSNVMNQLSTTNKNLSIKAILNPDGTNLPTLRSISTGFSFDDQPPSDTSDIVFKNTINSSIGCTGNECYTNQQTPYFSWTSSTDDMSGVKGYCLYLGTSQNGDPGATGNNNILKSSNSPINTTNTPCQFIIDTPEIDLTSPNDYHYNYGTEQMGYYYYYDYYYDDYSAIQTSFPLNTGDYYFNIKAIDNIGNISANSTSFKINFDNTPPTNVAYISPSSGNFSNVNDMSFSWPTSGTSASSDSSGVLGWQYQLNSTDSNGWQGTANSTLLNIDYIPLNNSSYNLTQARDGNKIVSGNNVIYFRTVDITGSYSSNSTIRTGNLAFGGAAPSFAQSDKITVNPTSSTNNSFSLSWPQATPDTDRNVTHYYYMINNPPPSTLDTLQGNASTYIDNGNSTTVAAKNLPGIHKGTNTVYVVAIDDSPTPNYSPSNYTSGTFELDSTDPDPVANLVASDSSIKSQSQWNVTLTWTAPVYQGAGNLVYHVLRSSDGISFTETGTSTGLSFVDNAQSSKTYYYKVQTKDGAGAGDYSFTNTVSITPTGKWTSAPTLENQPTVTNITTKKATVTWSTNRSSDSKVAFGTTSGKYNDEEPSNSSQVSSHSINLTGLLPGTTYYYKTKWTDEDGNTGTSEEKSFTTAPAPVIKDVTVKNINLNSGLIQFTSTGASKVKVYYGNSTSFGGALEIPTSTNEATYTINLIGLLDGVKYYYKINAFDSENSEYEGTTLDFTTIARPKITNVQLQEVAGTSQSTILVTWDTNTEVSSIVTYYPEGQPDQSHDEVSVQLVKGEHKMILRGLTNQLKYTLIVKGRDRNGNEALSDTHRFTTASDTRPPQISSLSVEGQSVPQISGAAQEATAQLTVSWNTDEPATSQVEFSEGTGTDYSQKTQEDTKLTYNHLVIISNLTPSKVYHLKAVSRDKAFNTGKSIDTVTIAPKATDNALDLVVSNLSQVFGFLGGLGK